MSLENLEKKTKKELIEIINNQYHLANAVDAKDKEINKLTNDLVKKQDKINEELKEENEQLKADIAFLERKFLSMTDIFAYNLKDQQALLERNNFSRNEVFEDYQIYLKSKKEREKGKEVKK